MKKYFLVPVSCFLFLISCAYSQNVGVGTSNPQNKLHVAGGLRLDTLTGVGGAGLLRHDANGVVYGIKFSGSSNDVLRGDGSFGALNIDGAIGWLMNGNNGTNPATNFIGTTDNQPLLFRVNNIRHGYLGKNIFLGSGAGALSSSSLYASIGIGSGALGKNNQTNGMVAIGDSSSYNSQFNFSLSENTAVGYRSLYANTLGNYNTAFGGSALSSNTTGETNTGIGIHALQSNTTGSLNTAVGYSMLVNTTGFWNTAVGGQSLFYNQTGNYNTAVGVNALEYNTTGTDNTAIGQAAGTGGGFGQGTGSRNTSVGSAALASNRVSENTAVGYRALVHNTDGIHNDALGAYVLEDNIAGSYNCAFGTKALQKNDAVLNSAFGYYALNANRSGWINTAVGAQALSNHTTGDGNTAVGYYAGNTLDGQENVTCIGYATGWNTTISNQVNIGNFSVSWIGGQVGWFHYSDKRMKTNIKDDVPGLAFITRLKPITYNLDIRLQEQIANGGKESRSELPDIGQKELEGKYNIEKTKMTGFFAQDVEDAAKAINYSFSGVYNPKNGGLLSLDYSAFVVPLVKAVQEQQTIIEKQQKQIDDLLKRIEVLEKK